jgi:hypothetical protein
VGEDRRAQLIPGEFFPLYPFINYGDNICQGEFNRPGGFRLEAGLKGEFASLPPT